MDLQGITAALGADSVIVVNDGGSDRRFLVAHWGSVEHAVQLNLQAMAGDFPVTELSRAAHAMLDWKRSRDAQRPS